MMKAQVKRVKHVSGMPSSSFMGEESCYALDDDASSSRGGWQRSFVQVCFSCSALDRDDRNQHSCGQQLGVRELSG